MVGGCLLLQMYILKFRRISTFSTAEGLGFYFDEKVA